jgi:predicted ATPase
MMEYAAMKVNPRYILHESLGMGGMGHVYRAYDRLFGEDVALKRLHMEVIKTLATTQTLSGSSGEEPGMLLAREFHTLASLRHRHIVDVRDYGFDRAGQPFYTMTLIDKPLTLLQAAIDQPIKEQIRLLGELLLALAYLHRRGIVHRDLKPDNVLLNRRRMVKVVDFGLAVQAGQAEGVQGTILYVAPEVLLGQPLGSRADLYAVGVMAYKLLAGENPFHAADLQSFLDQITHQPVDFAPLTQALEARAIPPATVDALSAFVRRLMEREPAARYDSASDALLALYATVEMTPPPETAELRESYLEAARFVGRRDELRRLKDALQEAQYGKGSAWLVGGESGVGKSRLLAELRTWGLVNGVLVLRGQAVEGGGLPYQLWRGVLPRLALESQLSDLEAGVLKPLIPNIEQLLDRPIPDPPEVPGEGGQQRLFLAIIELFKRQSQPVLLILEDLQWTDESLTLLQQLNRFVAEIPLLVVASYRDDEAPHLPHALPEMEVLSLERLSGEEIASLSRSMLGESGQKAPIVDLLQRETEGNVFFLVEVVRALAEEIGSLDQIGEMTLPASVFSGGMARVVQRRLQRVPEWGQALLRLAAVAGRQLDTAVLDYLCANDDRLLAEHTLDDWLTACSNVAVLEVTEETWRFAHDKLREVLLQQANSPTLHRRVAEAIEAVYPVTDAHADALHTHWQAAGDVEKELSYLAPLGRHLLNISDFMAARRLLEDGVARDVQPSLRRVGLLHLLTEVQNQLGDHDAGLPRAQESLQLAQQLGDKAATATSLRHLGIILQRKGDFDQARQHFEQSLATFSELGDQHGQATCMVNLAGLDQSKGAVQHSSDRLQAALDLFRAAGDPYGEADALNRLGSNYRIQTQMAVGVQYHEQALAIYQQIGNPLGQAQTLILLANAAAEHSDYVTAEQRNLQSLQTLREIGSRPGELEALNNLAITMAKKGDYKKSKAYFEESLVVARAIGNPLTTARALENLGILAVLAGDLADAERYFDEAIVAGRDLDHPAMVSSALLGRGNLAMYQADLAAAKDYLSESLAIARKTEHTHLIANSLEALGNVYALEKDLPTALDYLEQALAIFKRANHPLAISATLVDQAEAHLLQGDGATARPLLQEALDIAWKTESMPQVARSLAGYAWLVLIEGQPGRGRQLIDLVDAQPAAYYRTRRLLEKLVEDFDLPPGADDRELPDLKATVEELLTPPG